MVLTDNEQNYKLSVVRQTLSHFFALNCVKDWAFENYYKQTHNGLNKPKNLKKIIAEYNHGLDWIANLEVPEAIKEHVKALSAKQKVKTGSNIKH